MSYFARFLGLLLLQFTQFHLPGASFQCGIRKYIVPLAHYGWEPTEGFWPWHVAIFHKQGDKYACGGTLIDERHVLTAAHCVVKKAVKKATPANLHEIELHFGRHNLSELTDHVVKRDVSKVHVHPEYEPKKNDIAVMVTRLPVEFSEYVIPICINQRVDRDLRELEGQRGWITGWGKTENGTTSEVLRTLSLPVVTYLQCIKDDPNLYGNLVDANEFCAGNRNGTSPGLGDSGGGFYVSDGDRWVIRGIVSFGSFNRATLALDSYKYVVFVNVQHHLTWIREVLAESESRRNRRKKRISEMECDRLQTFVKLRQDGECFNHRYSHQVQVLRLGGLLLCNGVLVNEDNVITTCSCIRRNDQYRGYDFVKVQIDKSEYNVSQIFCHPKYSGGPNFNLAILKLQDYVLPNRRLIPACLANNWTENLYDDLYTFAFAFRGDYEASNTNRKTSYEKCGYNSSEVIGEICVLNPNVNVPFTPNSHNIFISPGLVLQTWNKRSCRSTMVGIQSEDGKEYKLFTQISYHLEWLEQSIWNQPQVFISYQCGSSETFYLGNVDFSRRDPDAIERNCVGLLIDHWHILTSAQCVVNQTTGTVLPAESLELYIREPSWTHVRYVTKVDASLPYMDQGVALLTIDWPVMHSTYCRRCCISTAANRNIGQVKTVKSLFDFTIDLYRSENQSNPNMFCASSENASSTLPSLGSPVYDDSLTVLGILTFELPYKCYELLMFNDAPKIKTRIENFSDKTFNRIYQRECDRFNTLTEKRYGTCNNHGTFNVFLVDDEEQRIGFGVLVKENRVLTACQYIRDPHRPTGVLFDGLLSFTTAILGMVCHPDYNSTNGNHDLAVLKLATPVELSCDLIPACLPNIRTENLANALLLNSHGFPESSYEYITTEEICSDIIMTRYKEKYLNASRFCITTRASKIPNINSSIVQFVNSQTCTFTVVGIGISATITDVFVDGSSKFDISFIVTRLAYYLDWIEQAVWDEELSSEQKLTAERRINVSKVIPLVRPRQNVKNGN